MSDGKYQATSVLFEFGDAPNTPAGYAPVEGAFDALSQKVTLPVVDDTPEVVDYVPTAPADTALETWAWDAGTRRWVSTPTLLANKEALRAAVQQQIDALEANDSHQRSLREIVLALQAATTPPIESVTALTTIDDEIIALRATLDEIDAATTPEELAAIVIP